MAVQSVTLRQIEASAHEKYAKIVGQLGWGLKPCPAGMKCRVCKVFLDTTYLLQMRNAYVAGIPPDLIPAMMGIKEWCDTGNIGVRQLEHHARRQGWASRRKQVRYQVLTQEMLEQLALRRAIEGMDVRSPTQTDRMIEFLGRAKGMGQKIQIEGEVHHSWEERMLRAQRTNDEMVITIDEEAIEVNQAYIEGEDDTGD